MKDTAGISLLNNPSFWIGLFLLVLFTRLITTVYYIEEPDALRFALAVKEFDLSKFQPHFPGYPIFVALAKVFTSFTGSFSIAFSIIGAMGIWLIIFSLFRINLSLNGPDSRSWVLIALLFFNPYLWIMSNTQMPDLFATGLVSLAAYFLVGALQKNDIRYVFAFQFTTAILAGTRLSYLPLLFIPALYLLIAYKERLKQLAFGIVGIALWFIPLLAVTGWTGLLEAAQKQTEGHFSEWGGTILTEGSYGYRFIMLIRGLWADGLGGYWEGRSILTMVISVGLSTGLIVWLLYGRRYVNNQKRAYFLIFAGLATYLLWIFFYQNIIYKARHVLPLIPFLIWFIYLGFNCLLNTYRSLPAKLLMIFFMGIYGALGVTMAWQHTKPTAITQVRDYLAANIEEGDVIVSIPLVNDYLSLQNIKVNYVAIDTAGRVSDYLTTANKVYKIGILPQTGTEEVDQVKRFYHNPFINRMWNVVELHEYER